MSRHEPTVPSDDELAGAVSRVERLMGDMDADLADPALWNEPADLEQQIMAQISEPATPRPRVRLVWAAAVIVLVLVGTTAFAAIRATNAPDWSVDLVATDLSPGATASVAGWNESAGTRMTLDVDRLNAAPEGFVYELWLSSGPIHISAGTFRGTEGVELWAGVTRADFPRLWITLEPIDEDESPSGQTVLDTAGFD